MTDGRQVVRQLVHPTQQYPGRVFGRANNPWYGDTTDSRRRTFPVSLWTNTSRTLTSYTLDWSESTASTTIVYDVGWGSSTSTSTFVTYTNTYARNDLSGYTYVDEPYPAVWPMQNNVQAPARRAACSIAADTALALLMMCLNEQQRETYKVKKYFDVVSNKGNVFRIYHGRMHNVSRLDLAGNIVEEWCVTVLGDVPPGDCMLAQKMWLETDEDHLASKANITSRANGRTVRMAPANDQYNAGRDLAFARDIEAALSSIREVRA